MVSKIGVRELKNRASEIVREVHELEAEFVVTLRGEPVAVIRPLTEKGGRELLQAEEDEALAEVDRLAEKIARAWRSPKSALELLEEQRR
jgi:prevent-host-death family protein